MFYNGVHHAEEVMGLEVIMWMLDEMTAAYGVNDTITQWVDDLEIWFIPILNPEGHDIVTAGTDTIWRKNKFDNNGNSTFDPLLDGVDINHNYDFNWATGGSDNPASEYYRGPSAGSEAETQILCDFCLEHKPLFSLNYHSPRSSPGDLVYYPWYWPLQGFSPDHHTIFPIVSELCARTLTEADTPYMAQYRLCGRGQVPQLAVRHRRDHRAHDGDPERVVPAGWAEGGGHLRPRVDGLVLPARARVRGRASPGT